MRPVGRFCVGAAAPALGRNGVGMQVLQKYGLKIITSLPTALDLCLRNETGTAGGSFGVQPLAMCAQMGMQTSGEESGV